MTETRRIVVPTAEAMIDFPIPCLDKGHVTLKEYMGGDELVVKAARVSYGKGTKTPAEDRGLIFYLMENYHTSPLEQVIITFHTKQPIFVARQIVRHRTARLNEISGRYSEMRDEFYVPTLERMQKQATANKQGSGETFHEDMAQGFVDSMVAEQTQAYENYKGYLNEDMAKELARIDLPLSLYTEWYWQIDLHNLFHFLGLRLDWHAQHEVRVYAEAMAQIAKAVAPVCYEAFIEHRRDAVRFSASEMVALRDAFSGKPPSLEKKALIKFNEKIWSSVKGRLDK